MNRSPTDTCSECSAPLGEPTLERRQILRAGFATRKAAAAAEREFLTEIDRGRDPVPADITFGAWAVEWLSSDHVRGLSDNTARTYESYVINRIVPALGNMPLVEVKARHIRQLKESLGSDLAASTVNQILAVIGLVLKAAVEAELVDTNARRDVSRAKGTRPDLTVPTAEEVAEIEAEAGGTMWATPVT